MKFSPVVGVMLLSLFVLSSPVFSKDKDKKAAVDAAIDRGLMDEKEKKREKPDNPGEHGRENAAEHQLESHGQDSKKDESPLEAATREEREREQKGDMKKHRQ